MEADKRSELVGVATQLFKEQEQEEARAAKQKELEDIEGLREGRAVVKGEEHTRTNGGGGSGDAEGNWGEGRMGNEEDEAGEGVRDTPSSSGDDMDVEAGSKAEGQEAGDAEGGGSSQGASAGVGLTEEERKKRERLKVCSGPCYQPPLFSMIVCRAVQAFTMLLSRAAVHLQIACKSGSC